MVVLDKIIDKLFYVIVAVLGYYFLKSEGADLLASIKRFFNGGQNTAGSGNTGATDFLDVKNSGLSYKKSEYALMVTRLIAAFEFGTDEEEIKNVFEMLKTADDVKQLVNEFGLQPYDPFWGDVSDVFFAFSEPYDLFSILKSELSQNDPVYTLVRQKFKLAGYLF